MRYTATLVLDREGHTERCSIVDISDGGARITLEEPRDLPDNFILLFTTTGTVRRLCRRVWQDGATYGIAFTDVMQPVDAVSGAE